MNEAYEDISRFFPKRISGIQIIVIVILIEITGINDILRATMCIPSHARLHAQKVSLEKRAT